MFDQENGDEKIQELHEAFVKSQAGERLVLLLHIYFVPADGIPSLCMLARAPASFLTDFVGPLQESKIQESAANSTKDVNEKFPKQVVLHIHLSLSISHFPLPPSRSVCVCVSRACLRDHKYQLSLPPPLLCAAKSLMGEPAQVDPLARVQDHGSRQVHFLGQNHSGFFPPVPLSFC